MKKNNVIDQNYLEFKPSRNPSIAWSANEDGVITLEIENTGWANRLAQKLFKKPKISYVHLDEMGSFVWPLIDGERSILDIAPLVAEHFGEKANPLCERLAKFFQILESYHFVSVNK